MVVPDSEIDPSDRSCNTQEFRAELQAAETKDKKFVKRKTVLKKVVANITMGNDSRYKFRHSAMYMGSSWVQQCHRSSPTLFSVWGRHCWKSRKVCSLVLSS